MKAGTPDHPKMMELAEAIQAHMAEGGLRLPHQLCLAIANGMVERLWHFTAKYCPAGDIGKHSDRQIATAACWPFDAAWLIECLIDRKWVDQIGGDARLYIHDWHTHCEDYTHKVLARRVQPFANGTVPRFTRLDRNERDSVRKQWGEIYGIDIDNPKPCVQIAVLDARNQQSGRPPGVQNGNPGTVPLPLPLPLPCFGAASPPNKSAPPPANANPPEPTVRAEDVPLPPELNTEVFRASLRDWFAQRRRKRLSLRPEYLTRSYARLLPLGPADAAACLAYTVDQDYDGFFPEKFSNGQRPNGNSNPTTTRSQRYRG